jgi:hypothetical protein
MGEQSKIKQREVYRAFARAVVVSIYPFTITRGDTYA